MKDIPLTGRLSHLLAALCDATITDAEFDELQACLLADEDARLAYVRFVSLHANLFAMLPLSAAAEKPLEPAVACPEGSDSRLLQDVRARVAVEAELAAAAATVRPAEHSSSAVQRFPLRTTLLAIATVAAVFYGAFAAISWNLRPTLDTSPSTDLSNKAPAVAVIRDAAKADWASKPTAGEAFKLETGAIEQTLAQGAKIVVEGPAEWSVAGNNRVTLDVGKVLANVPQQAIGFTVVTPTSKIVDLGTEFGVSVNERGQTQTQVFQGEVEVESGNAKTGASNTAETRQPPTVRRLVAGEAVCIDARGSITSIVPTAAKPEQFIQRARVAARPTGMAEASLSDAYSQAVLQTPGLVAYWRLADGGRMEVKDEVGATQQQPLGRSPGKYLGFRGDSLNQRGALSASKSGAVFFDGHSCVEIPNQSHLSGDWDGLTLAAWIKPGRVQPPESDLSVIVGNWANQPASDTYCLSYRDGHLNMAAGNGVNGQVSVAGVGNVPFTFDAYHFAVGTWQKQDGSYRLYVDGEADLAQMQQAPPWKLHAGRSHSVSIGGQRITGDRHFVGAIDEVSVFNRALTPQEVKQLYQRAFEGDKQQASTTQK
jgi:hypothetical protein